MLTLGCHLSVSKGYLGMAKEAARIGANCFQFFTRNPRGAKAKALDPDDIAAFRAFTAEKGIGPILGHAAYTINPASTDPHKREFAQTIMRDDIERLAVAPGALYVFHPGNHPDPASDDAARLVADTLNRVLPENGTITILLETMSGHGSEVGGTFEGLRAVIDRVERKEMLGVCLDSCHVFAAGYDIVNDLDGMLERFDAVIGLDRLRALHCNDSLFPLGSGKDRHANIGEGHISLPGFTKIVNNPVLSALPMYLETRNDPDGYGREITLLRGLEKRH